MRRPLHSIVSLLLLVMLVTGSRGVRHECAVAADANTAHTDHSQSHEEERPADDCQALAPCGVTLSAPAVPAPALNLTIIVSDVVLTNIPHPQPVLPHDTPPPRA